MTNQNETAFRNRNIKAISMQRDEPARFPGIHMGYWQRAKFACERAVVIATDCSEPNMFRQLP